MNLDSVREHYRRLWGEPSRTATFRLAVHTIEVYKWDAAANPEQVNLYATVGASAHPVPDRDPKHRLEFYVGLNPAQDGVARPLAMLALDSELHGTDMGHGHTVTYPEPLWSGTSMRSFLVVTPFQEIVPPLLMDDGTHVEFLQAIPLYASEVSFKSKHQVVGLIDRWQSVGVPFWDPNRTPEPAR